MSRYRLRRFFTRKRAAVEGDGTRGAAICVGSSGSILSPNGVIDDAGEASSIVGL